MKNICFCLIISMGLCFGLRAQTLTDTDNDGAPVPFFISRLAKWCLCLIISMGLCFGLRAQTLTDTDGDGLKEIRTLADLNSVRNGLTDSYELMNDLDFSDPDATGYNEAWDGEVQTPKGNSAGAGFPPIGDASTEFRGTFEGNGHVIKNLYVNAVGSSTVRAGLFGHARGATIRNLGLIGEHMSVKARSTGSGEAWVGGLVSNFDGSGGTVRNCYATGAVSATSTTGQAYAGGLVGRFSADEIKNCYATGEVSASATSGILFAGGLVGWTQGGAIRHCYATGNLTVTSSGNKLAGGLIGRHAGSTTIESIYRLSTATITGASGNNVGTATTLDGLRRLTAASTGWSGKDWYFGADTELPRLRAYTLDAGMNQIVGELLRGQAAWALDANGLVGELRTLVGDYTTDVDVAVSGEDYLRVKHLVGEVGKIGDKADKSMTYTRTQLYTQTEADGRYAVKATEGKVSTLETEMDTAEGKIGVLVTAVGTDGDTAAATGSLYARVARHKADIALRATQAALDTEKGRIDALSSGKADQSALDTEKGRIDALSSGKADQSALDTEKGRVDTLRGEMNTAKTEIVTLKTQVGNLSTGGGGGGGAYNDAELRGKIMALETGKADKTTTYTRSQLYTKAEADGKFALKTAFEALQTRVGTLVTDGDGVMVDLSAYALKTELPDVSGKADKSDTYVRSRLYTKAEADGKFAKKTDLPDVSSYVSKADFDALKKELEALKKSVSGSARFDPVWATAWLETRIVVRPNPVKDRLIISSPVSVVATVLDSSGQLLLTRQLLRGEQVVDVSGLVAGNYLLVLQAEGGETSTYKFVKEHQ